MNKVTVEILGWDKYNPRKDIKNPSWFAFSNRMIEDPDIYDLTHSEFRAWVYCLSRASQKASSIAEIDYRHARRIANIEQCDFENMFKKMEKNVSVRQTYADVRPSVHDKQTNRQDKQTGQTVGDEEKNEEFNIPEKVIASYQMTMGYTTEIIDRVAKEAWPLYRADNKPGKNWERFLSHYIKNEKANIELLMREEIEREQMRKKYEGSEYEF